MGRKKKGLLERAVAVHSYFPVIVLILITSMVVVMARAPDLPAIVDRAHLYRNTNETSIDPSSPTTVDIIPAHVVEDVIHPGEGHANASEQQNASLQGPEQASSESFVISALLTVGIFLPVAILGGFGIFLLFKFRKRISLKVLFSGAFGFISVATTMILLSLVIRFAFFLFGRELDLMTDASILFLGGLTFIPGLLAGVLLTRSIISSNVSTLWRNFSLLGLSLLIATFMTIVLPWYVMVFLIIGISIWDSWAARKGIIKEIVDISDRDMEERKNARRKELARRPAASAPLTGSAVPDRSSPPSGAPVKRRDPPAVSSAKEDDLTLYGMYEADTWSLGLGDLIFYSVLTAMTMTYFMTHLPFYDLYSISTLAVVPWVVMFVVGTAVFVGFLKTLRLLEKSDVLPGLPISMGMGLAAFILLIGAMELLNFIIYSDLVPVIP